MEGKLLDLRGNERRTFRSRGVVGGTRNKEEGGLKDNVRQRRENGDDETKKIEISSREIDIFLFYLYFERDRRGV